MPEKEFCPKCHENHDPDEECMDHDELLREALRAMKGMRKKAEDMAQPVAPPCPDDYEPMFIPPPAHIYGGGCHPFIAAVERVWFKLMDLGRPDSVKDAIEYTKEMWTLSQPFIKEMTDADVKEMEARRQEYMKKVAESRKPV